LVAYFLQLVASFNEDVFPAVGDKEQDPERATFSEAPRPALDPLAREIGRTEHDNASGSISKVEVWKTLRAVAVLFLPRRVAQRQRDVTSVNRVATSSFKGAQIAPSDTFACVSFLGSFLSGCGGGGGGQRNRHDRALRQTRDQPRIDGVFGAFATGTTRSVIFLP
jgi:hypothetical protein